MMLQNLLISSVSPVEKHDVWELNRSLLHLGRTGSTAQRDILDHPVCPLMSHSVGQPEFNNNLLLDSTLTDHKVSHQMVNGRYLYSALLSPYRPQSALHCSQSFTH